ncbi:hypothetical protein V757_07225 [Pelistega indica]|mgnify:CR=1 FL=1|uniref:Uncharacterized protein n=1 Tax=Pelistega indica TaxID=1414851 RepID=V8G2Q2_9BURK|nr:MULTISPECIES: hypothetical protein [Pelistega]ETD70804.1 hypothetical protein V757_07225 [Pelistega indica]
MRELRFSYPLTVLLFTVLPALLGFIVGAFFFIYHLFTHMGGDLKIGLAFQTWMLTIMHGIVMYGIPALVLGIISVFLLDKGMSKKAIVLFSVITMIVMVLWALFTVEFTGNTLLVALLALFGSYQWMYFLSVPHTQRVVPKLFNDAE